MKSGFMKFAGAVAACFLVITFFSGGFGWLNACPRAYAAWDVPPRPVPFVSFDLYTQKGGVGPNIPGGEFAPGEDVILYVRMTSDGFPVENRTIAFEIVGPANFRLNISFIRTAVTNSSGIACQAFSIQPVDHAQVTVLGAWTVTAQVGLDQETVADTLGFEVVPASIHTCHSACTCVRATFKLLR